MFPPFLPQHKAALVLISILILILIFPHTHTHSECAIVVHNTLYGHANIFNFLPLSFLNPFLSFTLSSTSPSLSLSLNYIYIHSQLYLHWLTSWRELYCYKSFSCFSTAFLNLCCFDSWLYIPSRTWNLSSRKLWENMVILGFSRSGDINPRRASHDILHGKILEFLHESLIALAQFCV